MLQLDPRTIYLTGAAFVAIGAVHLLVLAYRLPVAHRRIAKSWALGCFAASTSWVFFALDQVLPDIVTILFGNLTYLLAVVLLHRSVRLFDGLEQKLNLLYSLVAPAIALNLALKYVVDSFPARVSLMSLAVALPLALAARQLLNGVPKAARNTGRRMTAGWLIASSAILVVRAAAAPLGANFDVLAHDLMQGIVLGASLLSVTALVFSYYLLYFDRSTSELRDQAERDPLTGLLNRRAFEGRALREIQIAQERNRPLSLLLIDVNHFKQINDERGHDAGDETLRHIGSTVQRNLRYEDLPARLGGDEFVVLLPGLEEDLARALATRLGERVAVADANGYVTSISVGVASLQPGPADVNTLLKAADIDMYRAKRKHHLTLSDITLPETSVPG